MTRTIMPVAALMVLSLPIVVEAKPVSEIYIAPNGRDTWPGTRAKPLATLEAARDMLRQMRAAGQETKGGVTVWMRAGRYERTKPFALAKEDSGSAEAPIVYRAMPGERVCLSGGRLVTNFAPVTDQSILNRLDESARGKVVQADLRALGISDFGEVKSGGLELFFQDQPMTLARWPNEGFTHIADVVGGSPVDVRGTVGDAIGRFIYEGDRPRRWVGEKDPWVHGYWFWDWADERQQVESIDPERHMIAVAPPYHVYGYRKGQWFYGFNLLSELDSPGEWYLDRETGMLYFWPPGPIAEGRPTVSVAPALVTMNDTSYVTIRGLTLEAARGTGIAISGGTADQIVGCTIRNVGGYAVRIEGGSKNGVVGCDIYQVGGGGVILEGGDRVTLTPAGHYADNNHIHHYSRWTRMYQPAVTLNGVGNRATHNLIHDAPHQAIAFSGNDHVIEFNEIHDVCTEANDAGAIYAGRDWTWRGTVIRHNYLHDISGLSGNGCMGVYLDDMLCGTEISGNIFRRVTRAAFIGGGRDNTIANNIFVDCKPAVHVDARAMNWASYHVNTTMKEGLEAVPYQQAPWRDHYPNLPRILDDEPALPKGNVVARNICVGGEWEDIEDAARPLVKFEANLVGQDPRFMDAAHMDFRLRPDSPALKLGFQPIPAQEIGLYRDERRASWPAQ